MRTLFTIHAGEFLVGSQIEKSIAGAVVWLPSRDTGIDLLVTNADNSKIVSLQVKFSRDFLVTHMKSVFQHGLLASGWWTHRLSKVRKSNADLWVFVLQAFDPQKTQYILIPPNEFYERLVTIHGDKERVHSYFWVTQELKCWEARGLSKKDQISIANHAYADEQRDFTDYLNAWDVLERRLR